MAVDKLRQAVFAANERVDLNLEVGQCPSFCSSVDSASLPHLQIYSKPTGLIRILCVMRGRGLRPREMVLNASQTTTGAQIKSIIHSQLGTISLT